MPVGLAGQLARRDAGETALGGQRAAAYPHGLGPGHIADRPAEQGEPEPLRYVGVMPVSVVRSDVEG